MEQKTTTNEDKDALETPLINGRRESMELEQVSVETNADEPFWLKIVCFLGGVYPILRKNGKFKCNRKTVCWSIWPLVWSCLLIMRFIWFLAIIPSLFHYSTFQKDYVAVDNFMELLLPLSLFYTRKRFSDAIVGEENRLYINTVAKRSIIVIVIGIVVQCSFLVPQGHSSLQYPIIGSVFSNLLLCPLIVIIIRCLFLGHTSITQVKTELLEMVRGTEVEEVQTKLLEISKTIQEASVVYLQVPLTLLFILVMEKIVHSGILAYKNRDDNDYAAGLIIYVVIYGIALVTPLWLLTRIEKFYLWTLRELLHRNTVMPRTEYISLLLQYDTIAPRASVFGIYITRGRVASIILAILGSIAPKISIYLYNNIHTPY
eukprot:g8337.t1